MSLALKISNCLRGRSPEFLKFSRAIYESQNCSRREQNQTFYEFINISGLNSKESGPEGFGFGLLEKELRWEKNTIIIQKYCVWK